MKYLTYAMALFAFRLAQIIAPFRTGNLKFNAMFLVMQSTGFDIVYDDRFAHYIDFLEYGTPNSNKHVGFIENTTFWAIVSYLEDMLTGNNPYIYDAQVEMEESLNTQFETSSLEAREFQYITSTSRYEVVL